jgi:hypothetical protein
LIDVELFVSCGAEVEPLRDVANSTVQHLDNALRNVMRLPIRTSIAWDFRLDPPSVVPVGNKFARSLDMVARSNAVATILGDGLPEGTRQEILQAFEIRRSQPDFEVWMFLERRRRKQHHQDLLDRIEADFSEAVVYTYYRSRTDFQAKFVAAILPFVLRTLERNVPAVSFGSLA